MGGNTRSTVKYMMYSRYLKHMTGRKKIDIHKYKVIKLNKKVFLFINKF